MQKMLARKLWLIAAAVAEMTGNKIVAIRIKTSEVEVALSRQN